MNSFGPCNEPRARDELHRASSHCVHEPHAVGSTTATFQHWRSLPRSGSSGLPSDHFTRRGMPQLLEARRPDRLSKRVRNQETANPAAALSLMYIHTRVGVADLGGYFGC